MEPKIIPLKKYNDHRGSFFESFKYELLENIKFEIKQENTCVSNKNVIRGFHYQTGEYSQAKLLLVLNGKIKDVLVDIRSGKIFEFELSSDNPTLLYIPHGYAHGYAIYEDNTIVSYKTDALYNKDSEKGFHPLSKSLKIDWKIETPVISEKDMNLQEYIINE
tara:strand:+ start:256 stop:744 length:489 start_codon:yes stop_codon:yes gene_type:complete